MLTDSEATLICAVIDRELNTVNKLLSDGINPNFSWDDGVTPLMVAAGAGYFDIAKALLVAGANTNATDCFGHSPLIHAVDSKVPSVALVAALLQKGANPNIEVEGGRTPLTIIIASKFYSIALVRLLIEMGAMVNHKPDNTYPPLHLATQFDHLECATFLLEYGANVNLRSHDGTTALHAAVLFQKPKIARALVDEGANKEAGRERRASPLDFAKNMLRSAELIIEELSRAPSKL